MIAAIVQARMASTRLPGKVLKEVLGRPLLSYQIERLKRTSKIKKIIIATTVDSETDPIVQLCMKESVSYFRGSEEDVLDRYYKAAKKFGVKHVVRISSDCPLIDPNICNDVVTTYLNSDVDYVHTGSTFSEGLDCEVISINALERVWCGAVLKSEREHVTLYLHNHPELFKKITFHNETDDSKYRFAVDEPEDFEVIKDIIEALYDDSRLFLTNDVKNFLDSRPDVFKKNSHIIRNEGLMRSLKEGRVI